LDQARRVQCHSVKEGGFRSMVQATTGELELITADAAGNLNFASESCAQLVAVLLLRF